jgi:hypothetical protein
MALPRGLLTLILTNQFVRPIMYSEDNENIQATHEIISRDEAMMQQLEY